MALAEYVDTNMELAPSVLEPKTTHLYPAARHKRVMPTQPMDHFTGVQPVCSAP
jgi:hypothetical protein